MSGLVVLTALVGAGLAAPAGAAAPPCHVAVSDPVPKAPGSVTVTVHTSPRARAAFTSTPASQPPTVTVTADTSGAAAVRYTLQSVHTGRYSVQVAVTATNGQRASCSSVFTVNGKRPTRPPTIAPPPRPRGTTAGTFAAAAGTTTLSRSAAAAGTTTLSRSAAVAAYAAGSTVHHGVNCNWLYHEFTTSVINESPYTVAFYEWEYDWLNGVFRDRSGQWTYLGPGGINSKLVRHPFAGYVSVFAWFYVWDGVSWSAMSGYAGAGGSGAGVDPNGTQYCFA